MNRLIRTAILALVIAQACQAQKPWRVGSVTLSGNRAYTEKRLHRLMISRPPGLLTRPVFHERLFRDDVTALSLFYRQNGYLQSEVTALPVQYDSLKRRVHLSIAIEEGEPTVVDDVFILGNEVYSDSLLMKRVPLREGAVLRQKTIEQSTLALLTHYADNGFIHAQITPAQRVDTAGHHAYVDFMIQEGLKQHVGDILIQGNRKTRSPVIRRALTFKAGDAISLKALLKSQKNLYATGLFESVFIQPQDSGASHATLRNVMVQLKELPSIELNTALGYGSVDKLRTRLEIRNSNVTGRGYKTSLTLSASAVYQGASAAFILPRIRGIPWDVRLQSGIYRRRDPGFTLVEPGFRLALEREVINNLQYEGLYKNVWGRLTEIRTEALPADSLNRIMSWQNRLIWDSRDNIFDSHRGVYADISHEFGSSFGKGLNDFQRIELRLKFFTGRGIWVAASALSAGWMWGKGDLTDIPLPERFYAGGPSSVRGFAHQSLGRLDNQGKPTGGRFKLVWNILEIRRPIWKMVGAALFMDAGNVWSSWDDLQGGTLRLSPGAGIRISTPIGTARVDWAYNLKRKPGEKSSQWMFNMGQSF